MRKYLLSILFLIFIANTLFAFDYIQGYKMQKSYKSWENAARYYMDVKMYQLRQGGLGKYFGFFNKDFYGDNLKEALRRYEQACKVAISSRLKELDYDPYNPEMIKMLRITLPDERDSWESARNMFTAGANRRWIDSYAVWAAEERAGKPMDFESDAFSVAIGLKIFERYFDDFMLQDLDWYRDKNGELHIPDFLMDKYKKKYKIGEKIQ